MLAAIRALEKAYGDRILPIDTPTVAEWTRLLGGKSKDRWDLALTATALVDGLMLVTRNVTDFTGRGVHLLDPFRDPPQEWPPDLITPS